MARGASAGRITVLIIMQAEKAGKTTEA